MRPLLIATVICAAFLNTGPVAAQTNCLFSCPLGAPAANQVITRSIYTLSNNSTTKFADWVAYKVNQQNFSTVKRGRNWATEPGLNSSDTLTPPEYKDSNPALGVDRGHQAPLAAFKGHSDWAMTNRLSNITPQFSKLNRGPWKKLETRVRKLAQATGGDVFVMTGPLYEWPMAKLPATDKDHRVPSAYWKIIAVQSGAGVRAVGFYFYQDTPSRANFCEHLRSITYIEGKSGLDFFPTLAGAVTAGSTSPTLVQELGCT